MYMVILIIYGRNQITINGSSHWCMEDMARSVGLGKSVTVYIGKRTRKSNDTNAMNRVVLSNVEDANCLSMQPGCFLVKPETHLEAAM